MSEIEIVYIGSYDNSNNFQLKSGDVPISLASVTRIDADIEGINISSTNQPTDLIQWIGTGYATGEIRCKFGDSLGLIESQRNCFFVVYDPTNPNGIVFGPIILRLQNIS